MPVLAVHTETTAPEAARFSLASAEAKFGFIPNLIGVLAESPNALGAYLAIGEQFEESTFTPVEQHVVLLVVSRENHATYCMAAHAAIAASNGVPAELVEALRTGMPLADTRLEALAGFTRAMLRHRGQVPPTEVEDFLRAGFCRAQMLEVVLGIAIKTLSNYANQLAATPVDDAFGRAWWAPGEVAAAS